MTDNLKNAFDGICAGEKLKADTVQFLHNEIQKRRKIRKRSIVKRCAAALAFFMLGFFTYGSYFTPAAYVDLDINPSVGLVLNRFDRVIDICAYNNDGGVIIENISLKHKSYNDALIILINAINEQGYFQNGESVSVTLQTDDKDKENGLLANIKTGIEAYMTAHRCTGQIEIFPVSGDTHSHSQELNLSPAKYLAIQELIEVDPTATVDEYRSSSIGEIKKATQEHINHHNEGNGNHHGGSH